VKTLLRWGKFNAVGAMGMLVQLAALALFNRWSGGHYLLASAAAIEITLLHNFLWHLHYTWRDRREGTTWLGPCVRFHLSNGVVSLLGNLVLMRLLVGGEHLPVLAANVMSICCCSMVNFCLGNSWAFAGVREGKASRDRDIRDVAACSL
jgi:putative flippase GtrA